MLHPSLVRAGGASSIQHTSRVLQVHAPYWQALNDSQFEHMASEKTEGCNKFIMIDGHAKVTRSHCLGEVEAAEPAQAQAVGFVYNTRPVCSNTPAAPLSVYKGLCKDCYARLPPAVPGTQQRLLLERDNSEDEGPGGSNSNSDTGGGGDMPSATLEPAAGTSRAARSVANPYLLRSMLAGGGGTRVSGAVPECILDARAVPGAGLPDVGGAVQSCVFLVKWQGMLRSDASWEQPGTMQQQFGGQWECMLQQYQAQLLRPGFYSDLSEAEMHPNQGVPDAAGADVPDHLLPAARRKRKQQGKQLAFTDCKPRDGGKARFRTFGTIHKFCACGRPFPPTEAVAPESCSLVHMDLMKTFQGRGFPDGFVIGYDDACHLKPFCCNPKRLTPDAPQLAHDLAKLEIVVDRFHFDENHTGKYCTENCSPYRIPLLQQINMSVAEQQFSWFKEYARMMRPMNAARFNFFLLHICSLRQQWCDGRMS